jgi:pimeloyl-ACP methyl ester carboxylesterase
MRRRVGDVQLNVIDEGEGEAVLLLHGLGGSWRDWAPQVESLRDRYRVVAIDHRGHGRSPGTGGPYSTGLFAADALAVCRSLGIERAHVVGLSMGGLIAQALALAEPRFVDTLVLCDTGAYMPARMGEVLLATADAVRAGGFPDSRGVIQGSDLAWSGYTLEHQPHVVRDNRRESESTDPEEWARAARAVAEHDTRADLGRIAVPTLVIYGDEDRLILPDKASPALMDGLPDAELLLVADAGHLVNLEQPEAFDAAITRFFTERGQARREAPAPAARPA